MTTKDRWESWDEFKRQKWLAVYAAQYVALRAKVLEATGATTSRTIAESARMELLRSISNRAADIATEESESFESYAFPTHFAPRPR